MSSWKRFFIEKFDDLSQLVVFLTVLGIIVFLVNVLVGNPALSDSIHTLLVVVVGSITTISGLAAKELFSKKDKSKKE